MKRNRLAAFALIFASSLHAQTATAPVAADYSYTPPLPGTWDYARAADGSEANFRDAAGRVQLTFRCTRSVRRVTIAKPASAAAPSLSIWTSLQSRNLPTRFDPATARLSADLSAYDPLLDAIIFSRGRFAAQVSAAPALVVPPRAEVARIVEDCRS